jgi:hypothetical protein
VEKIQFTFISKCFFLVCFRAIDRQPSVRFDNVIKRNGMIAKKENMQSNINQLKNISAESFRYMYHSGLEISPDYP